MITDSELREIYSNAPVIKDTFEVITLKAPWFSQDYHIQHQFTYDVEVPLETGETVVAQFAPARFNQSSSNADLQYTRSIVIEQINDIIATEITNRTDRNSGKITVESRGYVMYRDGTISGLKTAVISTEVQSVTRNETGAVINTSTKPINNVATGEVATVARVPMLKGFL